MPNVLQSATVQRLIERIESSSTMSGSYSVSCFVLLLAHSVVCMPDGAPDGACFDMTPEHGAAPQKTPCPFVTSLDKKEIFSNGSVLVTLNPGDDVSVFKGFLVMAFKNNSADSTTPIGKFSDVGEEGQLKNCSAKIEVAVTHTDNKEKLFASAKWTPPADFDGAVVFRTTFVQEENMFWTRVPSAVLRVVRASSRQSDSNTTTTTTSTTTTTTTTTTMAPTVHAEVPASASHVSVVAVYCAVVLGLMLMFVF